MAGPGGDGPEPGAAHDGAKDATDATDAQTARKARGPVATVALLLLAALAVRVFVTAKRTRFPRSAEKGKRLTRPAPHSVIRIAAAPHSVVYVVSAPSLGRSHVVTPSGPGARLGQGHGLPAQGGTPPSRRIATRRGRGARGQTVVDSRSIAGL